MITSVTQSEGTEGGVAGVGMEELVYMREHWHG